MRNPPPTPTSPVANPSPTPCAAMIAVPQAGARSPGFIAQAGASPARGFRNMSAEAVTMSPARRRSWTAPGTHCATCAPSQVPAMPGTARSTALVQSMRRCAAARRTPTRAIAPTIASDSAIAVFSACPTR